MGKTLAIVLLVVASVVVWSGCDLSTHNPGTSSTRSIGNGLVINEVFTIPPQEPYAFSWIELYNASTRTIRWSSNTVPAGGFVVGGLGSILTTTNGGAVWTTIASGTNQLLRADRFREPDSGYIVGNAGTILRSTDRGKTWNPQVSGVTVDLYGVTVTNPAVGSKTAWVCGDSGTTLVTFDNGANWSPSFTPIGTAKTLRSISMYSEAGELGTLWVAGDGGNVWSSTNAASSWVRRGAGTGVANYDLYSVDCIGATGKDTVWVCGSQGSVFVSRDAGNHSAWVFESTYVSATLRSIFVSKPRYGSEFEAGLVWAVGDNGTIIKSYDNGSTWTIIPTSTPYNLNKVVFIDSLDGWAFGDHGTILRTIDGGESWGTETSGTVADLYGAYYYQVGQLPQIADQYLLEMLAQRRHVFFDPLQPFRAGVNPNFDFITFIDTGYVEYNSGFNFGALGGEPQLDPIHAGGFVVVTSDSGKFVDHYTLGPALQKQRANLSIANYGGGLGFCLWTLLPQGEVRLMEVLQSSKITQTGFFQFTIVIDTVNSSVHDVDVVRYGNYTMSDSNAAQLALRFFAPAAATLQNGDCYLYKVQRYPNNKAAGYIPEYWSLARYSNDLIVDLPTENTSQSFYLTSVPIPGWYSQRSR